MISGELKANINDFLKNYALFIALGVVLLIAAVILVIVLVNRKNSPKVERQNMVIESNDWLDAIGGRENLLEINAVGSRLTLKLADPNKVDEARLKELGVNNILKMSNKIVLVVEDQAEAIYKQLNEK